MDKIAMYKEYVMDKIAKEKNQPNTVQIVGNGIAGTMGAVAANTGIGGKMIRDNASSRHVPLMPFKKSVNESISHNKLDVDYIIVDDLNLNMAMDPKAIKKRLQKKGAQMKAKNRAAYDALSLISENPRPVAAFSKNEPYALHELGHVRQFNKNTLINRLAPRRVGKNSLVLAPLALPGVRNAIRKGSGNNEHVDKAMNFVEKHPEAAFFTASAPLLLHEGEASAFAVKELVRKHGLGKGLKKSAPLAAALGTYATMGAIPAVGLGTASRLINHHYNKKKKESEVQNHG